MARARPSAVEPEWQLRFYIAGRTARAAHALETIVVLCEERIAGRFEIEVIDLVVTPGRAAADQILALPCLVRALPQPKTIIAGFPRDRERLATELALPLQH